MLVMAAACHTALAQTENRLVIETEGGTSEEYALKDIDRITFSKGEMNVAAKGGNTESFSLAEILKMYFTEKKNIGNVKQQEPRLICHENMLSVEGLEGLHDMFIYNLNGQVAYKAQRWDGHCTDISSLSTGIYILKVSDKSFKFIK